MDFISSFVDHPVINVFLFGFFRPEWWGYFAYVLLLTHITIAAVTIYLHRCQAHRSLELAPPAAHFFRFWLWLTTGMVTREWAAVHRKHHAKAETEEDPHSPQVHGILNIVFLGVKYYVRAKNEDGTVERYGYGAPDDWIERNVYTPHCRLGVTTMAIINTALFGLIPGMLVWTVQMIWIPFWAAGVVNGVGHFLGYRNFQPQDESRNIVPVGVIIGGEELHNNHHAFPTSARLSNRWYEFDIGWLYIRLMEKCYLAKVKRVAPKLLSSDSRAACDLDTLQSVITNRLEVVSRFSKSVKKVCCNEVLRIKESKQIKMPSPQVISDWLYGLERRFSSVDRQQIEQLIKESAVVAKIAEFRHELVSLWEDRSLSPEELIERLRCWCNKAEQSGIASLAYFAAELRGYRTVPAR